MPRIENVSLQDIECGNHMVIGDKSMLIQIVDPDMDFPLPANTFTEIYPFRT